MSGRMFRPSGLVVGVVSGLLFQAAVLRGASASASAQQASLSRADAQPPSLESVRAAYSGGRYQEAILLADQAISGFETRSTGIALAELHFWRGASLRVLERHEEALVALGASERLGLRVPELYFERALSRRALKQEEDAEQDYQEAERLLPLDDERRFRFAERWKGGRKPEPAFQLLLTPQLGFDSNLFGLEQDAPLIDDDAEEQSAYYGLVLGVKGILHQSDTQLLALEYRNQLRAYAEDSDLNYTDNVISAVGRQPFLPWADLEFRTMLGDATSDGEGHLRTTRTVAPAVLFQFSSAVQARLWGDWTDADYYLDDLPAEQDRDGTIARVGLVLGFDLGSGWSVAPHLGFARYEADGDDFDHEDWVAGLALTSGEYIGCVFSPSIAYTRAEYEHPNSVVGFTEERSDRIWRLGLSVMLRELEQVLGAAPTLSLAFLDHSSNLDPYDYRRWEPRVELTIVAMTF